MSRKNLFLILMIFMSAVILNEISASGELSIAVASFCTIITLYVLFRKTILSYIVGYVKKFQSWILDINFKKGEAIKDVESAIEKEHSTEKQIDEIAHHAHNNIQYLKKNSQEQIVLLKERTANIFAMNAHMQKNYCNNEIKSFIVNEIKQQLKQFLITSNKKHDDIKSSIERFEKFLKNKKDNLN